MNSLRTSCGNWHLIAALLIIPLTGCVQNLRGTISPHEQDLFRADAAQTLLEAAGSPDPFLRMHAIEAIKEVTPEVGIRAIGANIDNEDPRVRFAALMALGELRDKTFLSRIQVRAEDTDPNVAIAGIFAMHRLGDESRTSELADFLLNHLDARVRANAARAIGMLDEPKSIKLLRVALKRETKDLVKSQILESMARLGSQNAIERLAFSGYSDVPDQRFLAIFSLVNAGCRDREAERLFVYLLESGNQPEIRLLAARGLAQLGRDDGLDFALAYLMSRRTYTSERLDDPAEEQLPRIRGLAAFVLGDIGSPESLAALQRVFKNEERNQYVRVVIARSAIKIIDRYRSAIGYSMPIDGANTRTANQ